MKTSSAGVKYARQLLKLYNLLIDYIKDIQMTDTPGNPSGCCDLLYTNINVLIWHVDG